MFSAELLALEGLAQRVIAALGLGNSPCLVDKSPNRNLFTCSTRTHKSFLGSLYISIAIFQIFSSTFGNVDRAGCLKRTCLNKGRRRYNQRPVSFYSINLQKTSLLTNVSLSSLSKFLATVATDHGLLWQAECCM